MAKIMQQPARSEWTPPAGWFLLAIGAWLAALIWYRPLTLPDEGRYAGVAWDMLRAGSHGVPLLDGMPYFHKPPLYYWLSEFFFALFGPHPWLARLPSWMAAWGTSIALYFFVLRHRDRATATMTTLIRPACRSSTAARSSPTDMLVAGMISLCVLAAAETALRAERVRPIASCRWSPRRWPAGRARQGLDRAGAAGAVLFIWLVAGKRWRGLKALVWPPALLLFAAVAVPWFWLMQTRFSGFYDYFFVYQHFQRFAATGFNNAQPFWFYLPVIVGLALPWSLWGGGILRKTFWTGPTRELRLLAAIWAVVILAFFSLPASKLVGYVLPTLPPLAFLLAEVVVAAGATSTTRSRPGWCASAPAPALSSACWRWVSPDTTPGQRGAPGQVIRPQLQADDTFVSLHAYPFDRRSTCARSSRPGWWMTGSIPKLLRVTTGARSCMTPPSSIPPWASRC